MQSSSSFKHAASSKRFVVAGSLLAGLIALGGGGSPAPLAELACELLAAVALGAWIILVPRGETGTPAALRAVIVLVLVIPAIQLIPLPPAIWQALPGRENFLDALRLVDALDSWRAISISPYRTLAALLVLGPPLVLMWFAAHSTRQESEWMIGVVALMSLVSAVIGTQQLTLGAGTWLDFYRTGDVGVIHGFNANRNTAADIFLVGIVALALVWRTRPSWQTRTGSAALIGAGAVLVLAVFLSASRTGIAMIPLVAGFAIAIVRVGETREATFGRPGMKVTAAIPVLGLAVAIALWWNRNTSIVSAVLARFDFAGEFRPELWRDAGFAARSYWPLGSGLGTFQPAIYPAERLEVVDTTLPNRAHNELLELAIEGGLPLLACWLAIALIVGLGLRRAFASKSDLPRAQGLFCAAVLAIAALHSLVDYPLRSVGMASLAAMAAGIVLSARSRT